MDSGDAKISIRIEEVMLVVTQSFSTGVPSVENHHGSGGGSSTNQQLASELRYLGLG